MNTKSICSLTSAALLAASLHATTPGWQADVDKMIANGDFAKAELLMKKLPRDERMAQAVRIDSLNTIMKRIRADFSLTPEQGVAKIKERMPEATNAQIENWKKTKKLEVMTIDGKEMWFHKSVRNLWLLADEFATSNMADQQETTAERVNDFRVAMAADCDARGVRFWNKVQVTFTLDVDADAVPAGEVIRAWLPFPMENKRQRNIKFISSNLPATFSDGSIHHTVYMEAVAQKGKPTHFEQTFSYEVGEWHIAKQDMLVLLKPYDTNSQLYKRYTMSEPRHMIIDADITARAREIVGNETNPIEQASLLLKWIGTNFPWAGAREYSTIANIPNYVLNSGHGDCGQVTLLYITMCRSLGIPARWESGYMVQPNFNDFHDWCETYFEGIGWVPTDPSFIRGSVGTVIEDYYMSGLDVYRMASNEGVGGELSPAKQYIRTETVDFQEGEVEWKGGNIYNNKFSSKFLVDSFTPCK